MTLSDKHRILYASDKRSGGIKRFCQWGFGLIGLEISKKRRSTWSHPKSKGMIHQINRPMATYSPWLNDLEFIECYSKIRGHTLVDEYRCYELWSLVQQVGNLGGCILEVGVWRGGTGALLASAAKPWEHDHKTYLADTFQGVVKAGKNDTRYQGAEHDDTSQQVVEDLVQSLALNNVEILTGIFPDETAQSVEGGIALLHCDVDVYQSTKDIVEWALPKMIDGGVIIFDDYGFYGCEGIIRYANELKVRNDLFFIHNLNGHAVFVKIARTQLGNSSAQ